VCHRHGYRSKEYQQTLQDFFSNVERLLQVNSPDTLLVLLSDHGQVDGDKNKRIYINEVDPTVMDLLSDKHVGPVFLPGGYVRTPLFYAREGAKDELLSRIATIVGDNGKVFLTEELLSLGFWGEQPSQALRDRLGDIIITPYGGSLFWWSHHHLFDVPHISYHGGLTAEEMEAVFVAMEL
jgi:hypothetical protein